jgi:transcriptional regulator of acetoin/glycerol metabolism
MLSLPPLRERRDKVSVIRRMVDLEGQRHLALCDSVDRSVSIDEHALQMLERYHWPGNIRQLRTVIRVALAICSPSTIRVQDLPDEITKGSTVEPDRHSPRVSESPSLGPPASETDPDDHAQLPHVIGNEEERATLVQQLEEHHWNIANVARHLHVSRLTVYRRMKRFNISK